MQKWDIIHPNTALAGFTKVKPPWWARLIFQNRRLPRVCLQYKDDIMTSEAVSISCVMGRRLTSDSRLSWQVLAMTSPVHGCQVAENLFSISLSCLGIVLHSVELCMSFFLIMTEFVGVVYVFSVPLRVTRYKNIVSILTCFCNQQNWTHSQVSITAISW